MKGNGQLLEEALLSIPHQDDKQHESIYIAELANWFNDPEALRTVLQDYPAEALVRIFSMIDVHVDPEAVTATEDELVQDGGPRKLTEHVVALSDSQTSYYEELTARLVAIEARLENIDVGYRGEETRIELAHSLQQLSEVSQQRDALQMRNRQLEDEIGRILDETTSANVDPARIATSNRLRVDEVSRQYSTLYSQGIRDLQRVFNEFMAARDPLWDGRTSSSDLKTSLRVVFGRMMYQFGLAIRVDRLRTHVNDLCEEIEEFSHSREAVYRARTILLDQLGDVAHKHSQVAQLASNPNAVSLAYAPDDAEAALGLIHEVLSALDVEGIEREHYTDTLVRVMVLTIQSAHEIVEQIYSVGGEIWLAEPNSRFDPHTHEYSKNSAETGIVDDTEWPGFRVGATIVRAAIVI